MSSFQGIFFMMDQNSNPAGQKSASYRQNPKFSGQNKLLDNSLSSNHLMLDIFDTCHKLSSCLSIRVALPSSSHRAKVPSRRARRRCCAVSSSCAAAGEAHLDLPLSKSTREGGCCWTTGDYRSYSCPMSHSDMTELQWQFSHITQLDNGGGNFIQRSVRKDKMT